ncbi:MAG: hypothetical protein WA814_03170, partial [Candidatus Baltobacteraceae bacterium]
RTLERLARDGVSVRLCRDSEKLAVAGDRVWLGSANATVAFGASDEIDWGAATSEPTIVCAARDRIEAAWAAAKELRAR